MADVGIHGGVADAELIRNFLFDHALGEESEYFNFALGKVVLFFLCLLLT